METAWKWHGTAGDAAAIRLPLFRRRIRSLSPGYFDCKYSSVISSNTYGERRARWNAVICDVAVTLDGSRMEGTDVAL